jgi:CheY-like chemotaxis protein
MEKKLKILVVEDNENNIRAAEAMLAEHDVTIVSGYDQAREEILDDFDILLTDVMLPKGGYEMMGDEGRQLVKSQGEMPYGAYILLLALDKSRNKTIKKIGMITAGNHHNDPFVFALDGVEGFEIGDVKVAITNNCNLYVSTKNFSTIINVKKLDWDEMKKMISAGEIVEVKDWSRLLKGLTHDTSISDNLE